MTRLKLSKKKKSLVKSPIFGLDTKTYWLTDRQSQCHFDIPGATLAQRSDRGLPVTMICQTSLLVRDDTSWRLRLQRCRTWSWTLQWDSPLTLNKRLTDPLVVTCFGNEDGSSRIFRNSGKTVRSQTVISLSCIRVTHVSLQRLVINGTKSTSA
jgi:hypothetical protein